MHITDLDAHYRLGRTLQNCRTHQEATISYNVFFRSAEGVEKGVSHHTLPGCKHTWRVIAKDGTVRRTGTGDNGHQNLFSRPVLHDWCNKGYGMVHIKEPLLLIGKSGPCGGSEFALSLSEWTFTICLTPYNRKWNVLSASLNKHFLLPSSLSVKSAKVW